MASNSHVGIAPPRLRAYDLIALVHGSKLPLLLRPRNNRYSFHGFAWVYGIMDGKLENLLEATPLVKSEFHIV